MMTKDHDNRSTVIASSNRNYRRNHYMSSCDDYILYAILNQHRVFEAVLFSVIARENQGSHQNLMPYSFVAIHKNFKHVENIL